MTACCVMLCHVISCYAISCYAMLCHAMPYYVKLCYVIVHEHEHVMHEQGRGRLLNKRSVLRGWGGRVAHRCGRLCECGLSLLSLTISVREAVALVYCLSGPYG